MNVLITAGGTREYIDGVRYIGNSSTGRTGAQMTDHLINKGHQVTWLGAKDAIRPQANAVIESYETFDDLQQKLQQLLSEQHFDVVFHAAAVSDFKVSAVILNGQQIPAGRDCKIPTADEARLCLEKNPKLIDQIKGWSINPQMLLVGFKLTNTSNPKDIQEAVDQLLDRGVVDCVAHNNLPDISPEKHRLNLHQNNGLVQHCESPEALCDLIINQKEQAA